MIMKKFIGFFLTFVMAISMPFSAMATEDINSSATNIEQHITTNDYSVTVDVKYTWDDCYAANITISNLSETAIENWQLDFNLDADITMIENAQIAENNNDQYTLIPKAYSKIVPANDTIKIGVLISGTEEIMPSEFSLSGSYQDSQFVDATIFNKARFQEESDFYIVKDNVTSMSGTLDSIDYITNGTYTIEDEFGNILDSGNITNDETWKIENIGFGIGYNKVTLEGMSNDNTPIYSSFDVVNFNLANAEQIGIDTITDTDADGISNYLENSLGTDPYNANSINDNKTDDDSIIPAINTDIAESEYNQIEQTDSNTSMPDALAATSISSMIIHRSKYPEGSKLEMTFKDRFVADDLTYNDYSYEQLCEESTFFVNVDVEPEVNLWSDVAKTFAAAIASDEMENVLDEMLEVFRDGSRQGTSVKIGEIYSSSKYTKYSNSVLTSNVKNHTSTNYYTTLIKSYVTTQLRNGEDPYALRYVVGGSDNIIEDYVMTFDPSPYPSYDGTTALAIAIHGWHGHTITLEDYKETSTGFSGVLKFHFYDHFGLDPEDEIYSIGFSDWFALQHYTRFNGKYAPFLTYCDISVPFSGTFV